MKGGWIIAMLLGSAISAGVIEAGLADAAPIVVVSIIAAYAIIWDSVWDSAAEEYGSKIREAGRWK